MQRLSGDRRPLGAALDLDFSGLGQQALRIRGIAPSAALITAALLTAALSLAWSLAPERGGVAPVRDSFLLFPRTIDGRTASDSLLDPALERVLGADDYLAAVYVSPDRARPPIDLFLSWYADQTDGTAIHSPSVCLPGAGWEVAEIAPVTIMLPGTATGSVRLNRAVIQKGAETQLVYFWFEARGRQLTNDFMAKFTAMTDSLTRGRTDGGLVRLITPVAGSNGVPDPAAFAAADARLTEFLAAFIDRLPRVMPH